MKSSNASSKVSLALSAVVVTGGLVFGWLDHQRLRTVRVEHQKVVAEAAAAGLSLDAAHAGDGVRVTKRERADKSAEAKRAAADFLAFAREIEALEGKGEQPGPEMQQRIIDFTDRLMGLDGDQLKFLIAEIRGAKDLKDETRRGLIGFSAMSLASNHPQAALAIFTESSDLLGEGGMGRQVVLGALGKWAKDDPAGAIAWLRKNAEKFPTLVDEDTKRGLVAGAAAEDPKFAFSLIGELELKDRQLAISAITRAAKTSEERTATLAALRENAKNLEGRERDECLFFGISNLAMGAAGQGFEAGTQWLSSANLSDDELQQAIGGALSSNVRDGDTGKWIGWISESLPSQKAAEPIRNMVSRWAQNDYQAAGQWLAAQPAGDSKNTSIQAYAETISRYEPEAAAEWAATLPEGRNREETYRRIYQNWPKDDAAAKQAAEAFAEKHGIAR